MERTIKAKKWNNLERKWKGNIYFCQNVSRATRNKGLKHHLLVGEDDSPAFHQQASTFTLAIRSFNN
jgi:hypothetical protein